MWCIVEKAWPLWSLIAVIGFAYVEGKLPVRRPTGALRSLVDFAACAAAFLLMLALMMFLFPYAR